MTKKAIVWTSILAVAVIALLMVVSRQPHEPVSGGKPLSDQLPRLDNRSDTTARAASNALAAVTRQPLSPSASDEKADQAFNFQGMPLQQFLDMYENLAGKKVTMVETLEQGQMLRLKTVHPLTKSEAIQLFDEVLKEQAGLVIVHGQDGSLTAVAKP